MRINTNISYNVSKEDIKKAIEEYIDKRFDGTVDVSRPKVEIKVQDTGVDDRRLECHIVSYQLAGVNVTPSYLV